MMTSKNNESTNEQTQKPVSLLAGTEHPAQTLQCPVCSGTFIRQISIESYERTEEDGPITAFTIQGGNIHRNHNVDKNPSNRRNGLVINFLCETCHHDPKYWMKSLHKLCVWQHKGVTYMEWNITGTPEEV